MAESNPNIESIFTDVANAIREKKGTSETIYPVNFADEVASIPTGGEQPQLHAVTGLAQTAGVATWVGDPYVEAYKLYLDEVLLETKSAAMYNLTELTVTVGAHEFGVSATADKFIDADPAILPFNSYSITVNITNGIVTGPTIMSDFDTVELVVTPDEDYIATIDSVVGADYVYSRGKIALSNVVSDVVINITTEYEPQYIIGFSGAAQSNPALTRTDRAVGATITNTGGALEINGIDMSKVWGGYIGNDEEELTWDVVNGKYLHNGVEYTGNVFSKINRFFTKASYVEVNGEQVLDGYQLCYANAAPDDTWQDWFLGKPYTKIGCYKARGGDDWTHGLQSKQGLSGRSSINANNIAAASNLNTSTTATMHMKWYNQNSILQVLFMALFATRQTEDIFPQSTYRQYKNTQNTGYLDEMRTISTYATGYSTSKTGNMFLGIEDFVGYGYECLGGVKLNGTNVQTSLNYNTFNFNTTYTQADINVSNITSGNYISLLQESTSITGLLLPKKTTGSEITYYCDITRSGGVPIYQGASDPGGYNGMFCLYGNYAAAVSNDAWAARLCGEPL